MHLLLSPISLALAAGLANAANSLTPRALSCSPNSAAGRTIGYYQLAQSQRACDTVSVQQIDTTGLTHLFVAFAEFDPQNYTVTPARATPLASSYSNFTSLQQTSPSLQTWISVGGYSFSAPGSPTKHAWSNMTSSPASRTAFITSLASFMQTHSFLGVDLDWEFPGQPSNGGGPADTANLVSLVREMRAAYNTTYGISLTLPTDASYLAKYNLTALQPSLDFFGLMAYDISAYSAATPYIAAHSDIRIINATLANLLSLNVPASKINLGLAAYGRGYTMTSPSTCAYLGCPALNASLPGPCTSEPGVLSLSEINALLTATPQANLTTQFLPSAGVMALNYTDQFIAYDDAYTFSLKRALADAHCLGGTMMWSVDLDGGLAAASAAPAPTTTGRCGRQNGDTVCASWAGGGCCSAYGFCGATSEFCGSGCQSGTCAVGMEILHGVTNATAAPGAKSAAASVQGAWAWMWVLAVGMGFVF